MPDNFIEIQVDIPGKEYACVDYSATTGRLTLQQVVYPDISLPADLCSVPNTCIEGDTELPALLIRKIALAPGCRVPARPIGLCLITDGKVNQPILLFVPIGDATFAEVSRFEDLSEEEQVKIQDFLKSSGANHSELITQDSDSAWKAISTAQKNYRIRQTKQKKNNPIVPAWQPNSSLTVRRFSGETEQYTESEYRYWELPRRFQKYIEDYLQPNEHILISIHRPVMRSALMRDFLTGKQLQESVLIITDRQITLVEEKIPPSQSDVNYGYIATCCVPERLVSAEKISLNANVIGLRLGIQTSSGVQSVTLEFPVFCTDEINRIVTLLSGWVPTTNDNRLRRATMVNIPEKLPLLTDPSGDDPEEMKTIAQKYQERLSNTLMHDEVLLDWCLFPRWLSASGTTSVLAITPSRLLLLSEKNASRPILDILHHQIGSMEFCSTYMDAHLSLSLPQDQRVMEETIHFSKTLAAMDRCFRTLQQAIAVCPVHCQ